MDSQILQDRLFGHTDRLCTYIRGRIPPALQGFLVPEDIFQEVCAKAFRQAATYDLDAIGSFDAWITMLTKQCLADIIRTYRRLKRGRGHTILGEGDVASYVNLLADIASPGQTPSSDLALREAMTYLKISMACLPDEQREIVRMKHIEGRTYKDIASSTGQTVAIVRGTLDRAMLRLRTNMGRASRYFSDAGTSVEHSFAE